MSPSYFDGGVFLAGDEVEPAFFFVLLFVANALEQNIGLVGFGDSHHLDVLVLLLAAETDDLWEGELADLAFEFREVIALHYALYLLFYLAVDPSSQATHMDQPATSLAIARRNQWVTFGLLAAKTDLTAVFSFLYCLVVVLEVLGDFEDAVGFVEVDGIPNGGDAGFIFGLDDHVLDSA